MNIAVLRLLDSGLAKPPCRYAPANVTTPMPPPTLLKIDSISKPTPDGALGSIWPTGALIVRFAVVLTTIRWCVGDVPTLVESERRPLGVYATAFCWSSAPS